MNAQSKIVAMVAEPDEAADEVLIHVRFHPNGDIFTIDLTPANTQPNEWYVRLLESASAHYATRAGGRGFFRMPRERYEAILAAAG
jgi:hypothetical protein